jgi:transglutaminase-like putative cysteine protease
MQLRVLHHTQYDYQAPVVLAQHLAHLRPLELPDQAVLAHSLAITPEPAHREDSRDAFGNWRTFFALQSPHEMLSVTADSLIETQPPAELDDSPAWEAVREHMQYRAHAPFDAASEFVFPSPYAPRDDAFADFARPLFAARRPFLDACHDLMAKIHHELQYETASTEVHTPALQALAQGKGVCQDFAHIMIGCLRSLGLPARYVSGYLLTQPPPGQPRLIGADASHAWVSVPVGSRWYDFDPTNDRCGRNRPGEDYVTLTVGRDFGDISPLRGVIQGGGSHTLSVAVTVAPADEFSAITAE